MCNPRVFSAKVRLKLYVVHSVSVTAGARETAPLLAMTAAPFTVETLDTWGRVLVATRDIAPWELVLEDTCIATVPNDVPVCLGCLSQV